MSPRATGPRSLRIHTVFFKIEAGAVDRFLSSIAQAVQIAKDDDVISSATLSIGDCSPLPRFSDEDVASLRPTMVAAGLDAVEYTFFDSNLGSAEGHNRLMKGLDSDLVLIVNPDVVASPRLLTELVVPLSDSRVGAVEARQLPMEHPKTFDQFTGETGWAATACLLLRTEVVEAVGKFDSESFFLYCDDVDYSWRIRLAGFKVIYHPPARVFHDKRIDSNGHMQVGEAEEYYSAEAALFLAYKYSRDDVLESYRAGLAGGTPLQRKALATFEARLADGRMPVRLDPKHAVAEFTDAGTYTPHRF